MSSSSRYICGNNDALNVASAIRGLIDDPHRYHAGGF